MKKTIILILIIAILIVTIVFVAIRCSNKGSNVESKKTTITQAVYSYFNITMDVPVGEVEDTENPGTKVEGPLYTFQTKKPENCGYNADYFVVTDKAIIGFDLDSISSIASYSWYKEQYGNKIVTFDFYKTELLNNSNYSGTYKADMLTKFAGRDAFKVDYKYTENGSTLKHGVYYTVSLDDFADKYQSGVMKVYVTDLNFDASKVEEVLSDPETVDMLNSIQFVAQ